MSTNDQGGHAKIDPKEAARLFQQHGSWDEVAKVMHRPDGSHWTRNAIYQAVYHAGLPTNRYGYTKTFDTDGQIYRPLPERILDVVPDYARDVVVKRT